MDLNDILSDKPLPTPEPETDVKPPEAAPPEPVQPDPAAPSAAKTEEPAPDAKAPEAEPEAPARDENGRFAKTVPQEALHAERERRRKAEERLAELEKKPKTSVLEDEDKAFQERLSEAVAPMRSQFFELTVELAKEKPGRDDYDKVYEFMNAECEKHPELMPQIINAKNPGETIYQLGKSRMELAAVGGDLTKYRDHATAGLRTELDQTKQALKAALAEIEASKKSQEKRSQIPQSLNSEASAVVKGEQFAGPTPLKSILQ